MKVDIKKLSFAGVLAGIIFILGLTPIGLIPYGYVHLTILHIPVIIGTIVGGLDTGVALGAVFGLVSILNSFGVSLSSPTWLPQTLWSMSPFAVIVMCMVSRMMIAVVTFFVYSSIQRGAKPKLLGLKKLRSSNRLPNWARSSQTLSIAYAAVSGSLANSVLYFGMMGLFSALCGIGADYAVAISFGLIFFVIVEAVLAAVVSLIAVSKITNSRNAKKNIFQTDTQLINKKLGPDPDVIEEAVDDFEGVEDEPVAVIPSAASICPTMEFSQSKIHEKAVMYLDRGAVEIANQLFDRLMDSSADQAWRLNMGIYAIDKMVEAGEYKKAAERMMKLFNDGSAVPYWQDRDARTMSGLFSIINRAMLETPNLSDVQTQRMALAYNKIQKYITEGAWFLAGQVFGAYFSSIPIA